MNELCLYAGGGGGLLASKHLLGWRTVCYVEREPYCIEVIKARIRDGYLDDAPIWDDARTFDGRPWAGLVDVITAGFPCQPFSVAGQRKAGGDERNMWPHTLRIIQEVKPEFVFLENVPGLLSGSHGYFGQVLGELAESGYDARWKCISAAEVGAPHRRDRLWVVAHASGGCSGGQGKSYEDARLGLARSSEGFSGKHPDANLADADPIRCHGEGQSTQGAEAGEYARRESASRGEDVADPSSTGLAQREGETGERSQPAVARGDWWAVEPPLGRVVDGLPDRVGQLKALGNGQVPLVAAVAWGLLTESS